LFASLKIRASLPSDFYGIAAPLPMGLSELDLAVLYVAFLLKIGRLAADDYGRRQQVKPELGFTLGVPATFSDSPGLRDLFVEVAQLAWCIDVDAEAWLANGLEVELAKAKLEEARREAEAFQGTDPANWIRNESVAALHWAFRSPSLAEGLYCTVDVGAGTTNAAWFRILSKYRAGAWEKAEFVFFGSACRPPGVDKIDLELSNSLATGLDPSRLRGREVEVLAELGGHVDGALGQVFGEIFSVNQAAFRNAYPKHKVQSAWSDVGLLLFGGGCRIPHLVPHLCRKVWENLDGAPRRPDPGIPGDLREFDGGALNGDQDLLLVAYGLSVPLGDVPEVTGSGDVEAFEPWRYPSNEHLDSIEWLI